MADSAGGKTVGRISIQVVADLDGFYRTLRRRLEQIEDSIRTKINVEPDTDGFRQKVARATRNLPDAKIGVDVDRSALDRIRERIGKVFDGPSPSPSFGSGINGAGFAAIGAGAMALIAPALGLLTTALLTLPGLIAAVAAPVAALTLGLDGLKKAASRLAGPFEDLKKSMSTAVESQFGPVFDQVGKILPTLRSALPAVSQGMADIARSFADTITSSAGMARIEATIANIGNALSKAAPGIGAFTDGLLTLAERLTSKLPDLSGWFNGAGKSFSDWVQRITADGTLDKAFSGLGATLKTLADGLGSIASEGFKFMQDPQKLQDFNNGLKNIADTLRDIVNLSNQLSESRLFSNPLPSLNWEGIKKDITTPFTSEDAPWRDMWAGLQESAQSVWASVTQVVGQAVDTISGTVRSITATISSVWAGLGATASAAWNTVVSAVQTAISQVVAAVVSGGGQVLAEVASWPGKIAGALAGLAATGAEAGRQLVQGFINGIGDMVDRAVAKARELANRVRDAVKGALGINSPSKVFADLGAFTAQGFVQGLESQIGKVESAAQAMARAASLAVDKEIGSGFDFGEFAQKGLGIATDFGRATLDQGMADLGIGGGALTAALDQGLNFGIDALSGLVGDSFTFNVQSVDDAMAIKRAEMAKKALTYTRR